MRFGWLAFALAALLLHAPPVVADGDAARGQKLFARCSACHTTTGENKVGPSLAGVFGRTAGKVNGARYSDAMASSTIAWNVAALDSYLAAPTKVLSGTTMPISVPNAGDRADIIAYLRTLGSE